MNNTAQELQNLADNIKTSFVARMHFLKENDQNTKRTLQDAQKFIGTCRRDHKAMARQLHTDLGNFRVDLSDTVEGLRRKFQRQQAALHKDCRLAHSVWTTSQREMQKYRVHPYAVRSEKTLKKSKH